jgi:hypothetical protein
MVRPTKKAAEREDVRRTEIEHAAEQDDMIGCGGKGRGFAAPLQRTCSDPGAARLRPCNLPAERRVGTRFRGTGRGDDSAGLMQLPDYSRMECMKPVWWL